MKVLVALLLLGAALVSHRRGVRRRLGSYVGTIPSPLRFRLRQPAMRGVCVAATVAGAVVGPLWLLRSPTQGAPLALAFTAFLGAFCGLVFGLFVFELASAVRGAFRAAPKVPLEPGEVIRFAAKSNQIFRGEHRQGSLVLTTTRLAFCPGRYAVQREPWFVPLSEDVLLECPGEALLLVRAPTMSEPGVFLVRHSQAVLDGLRKCGIGLEPVSSGGAPSD